MTDPAPARPQRAPLHDLDADLAAVPDLAWSDLRQRWSEVTGRPVPRVRQALLRLALAWELQARAHGGLSRRAEQHLERMGAAASGTDSRTGMKLVREWNGALHTVIVDAGGAIHWNGQTWRSLSEVARAITGTRWSGPVFFGLRKTRAAA